MSTEKTANDDKSNLVNMVKGQLNHLWSFLSEYLPLANSQGSEFIVSNLWDTMVPRNIQAELMQMSDAELSSLPSRLSAKSWNLQADQSYHENEKLKCNGDADLHEKVKKQNTFTHVAISSEYHSCKYPNVENFISAAQKHTIDFSNILTDISDLQRKTGFQKFGDNFIGLLMSQKKNHEVDLMAELCSQLASSLKTELTVDLGSGKGYLSTQLCYQYNHHVVGIDASPTNTDGANNRTVRLGKELNIKAKSMKQSSRNNVGEQRCTKTSSSENTVQKCLKTVSGKCDCGCIIGTIEIQQLSDSLVDVTFSSDSEKPVLTSGTCNHGNDVGSSVTYEHGSSSAENSLINEEEDVSVLPKESDIFEPVVTLGFQNISITDNKNTVDEKWKDKFVPLTKYVDCNTDLLYSIQDAIVQLKLGNETPILLTGLHTCGGLGSSILRLFVNTPSARALCNVACCYNLMQEEFVANPYGESAVGSPGTHDFPMSKYLRERRVGLGKAARNIGCLAVHRMAAEGQLQGQSFYPRAMLQKIVQDLVGDFDWEGHRLRKVDKRSKSLFDYIMKCFTKLELPTDKVTTELIDNYDKKYSHIHRQMSAFVQLRAVLAPCIESFILLDRYLYLLEQETVRDVYLTRLFDPVISPRCYAIIATKNTL